MVLMGATPLHTEKISSTNFWLAYLTHSIRLRVFCLFYHHKLYQFLKTCTVYIFNFIVKNGQNCKFSRVFQAKSKEMDIFTRSDNKSVNIPSFTEKYQIKLGM